MERHRIKARINDATGAVTFEPEGTIKGKSCVDLTKGVEEAMGVIKSSDKKREYYEVANTNVRS